VGYLTKNYLTNISITNMDNIIQALLGTGPRKDTIGDLLKVYLGGQRVNPMGGIYKDFEEPLSMQYDPQYEPMQIMDPMVQGMMTPEVIEILKELKRRKSESMLDQNWEDYGTQNPYRYLNDLGTQIGE